MEQQHNVLLETSIEIGEIAKALASCQGQLGSAHKGSVNPHFRSKYADLTSVWEACRKPLSENKLSIVQMPTSKGIDVTLVTLLMHESGQWIKSSLTLKSGKDTAQAVGSAITYARRYALASILGITSDDDDDGNAASITHQRQQYSHPKPPPPKPQKAGFDPNNKSHYDAMSKKLKQMSVDEVKWVEIMDKMTGKSITELENVIGK